MGFWRFTGAAVIDGIITIVGLVLLYWFIGGSGVANKVHKRPKDEPKVKEWPKF